MIKRQTYKTIHNLMPIPCVDVVIRWRGKVLLGKRINEPAKGRWWLPGGRIKKGETLKRAASRKLFEETGIKAKKLSHIHTGETFLKRGRLENPPTLSIWFFSQIWIKSRKSTTTTARLLQMVLPH